MESIDYLWTKHEEFLKERDGDVLTAQEIKVTLKQMHDLVRWKADIAIAMMAALGKGSGVPQAMPTAEGQTSQEVVVETVAFSPDQQIIPTVFTEDSIPPHLKEP